MHDGKILTKEIINIDWKIRISAKKNKEKIGMLVQEGMLVWGSVIM